MNVILKCGDVVLPAPVKLSTADEIIWSSNTGRVADGSMVGDVIANKKTLDISWGLMKESDMLIIKNSLQSGFFPITFRDDGVDMTITSYRGTLTKEHIGVLGDGIYWYKSVSVSIIQQ